MGDSLGVPPPSLEPPSSVFLCCMVHSGSVVAQVVASCRAAQWGGRQWPTPGARAFHLPPGEIPSRGGATTLSGVLAKATAIKSSARDLTGSGVLQDYPLSLASPVCAGTRSHKLSVELLPYRRRVHLFRSRKAT